MRSYPALAPNRSSQCAEKNKQNLGPRADGKRGIRIATETGVFIKFILKARKLLFVTTDGGYHYAGDGKLAGIVKPNDGVCHMDAKGTYTHSLLQDYPSISHINHVGWQDSEQIF